MTTSYYCEDCPACGLRQLKRQQHSANHYAKYGHTPEYKARKRFEYQRRKEMKKYKKLMEQVDKEQEQQPVNMQQSSETTTARSEICC